MEHAIALQLVVVLATGTLLVGLCQHFRLSPILGYLATGVLVGPAALGWLPDGDATRLLAELGVVLLMFTIGLEFSLPHLLAAKRLVLGLGGAQVLLTALLLGLVGYLAGLSVIQALVMGAALSMSSTAIVLKQLGEQMELPAAHGRVVTAILLFQDVAAVPVLVVLPVLAADTSQLGSALVMALASASLVFVGLLLAGRYLLPPLLHWVAGTRSMELFMLTALLLALAAAGVSSLAGLSPTLGAFMAGMLLGETEFRHQIEADIRPFRDLMLGLFFVTIGMQLDPYVFLLAPLSVVLVLLALIVFKPLLLLPLVRHFGYSLQDAWRVSISLAQGGEFGLLVISMALALGLLGDDLVQPMLGGLILSMAIAPLLVRYNQTLAMLLTPGQGFSPRPDIEARIMARSSAFERHVIVIGYGRMGQNLLRILVEEGIPAAVLDLDPERVRQAAALGEPVMYGNATHPGVLRAAGIDRAQALAITIDDISAAERIVSHVRRMGFEGTVLVRSSQGRGDEALIEAGAVVFPEGLESSLAFAGQLLIMLDVPPSRVEARLNAIRAEDYAPLRVFFHASSGEAAREQELDYPCQARAVIIEDQHYAIGRTPHELRLPQHGVTLVNVQRGAIRVPGKLLDTRLRAGDVLLLQGTPDALEKAIAEVEGR